MKNNYFESNKTIKLSYEIFGDGPEKILLLPGILSCSQTTLKHQINYIINNSQQYQIGCFNYRGIGESEFLKTSLGIRDHSMDVEDFLNYLKWDKVHIVSTSFGSQVAFDFALYAPHRIKSLLLSSLKPPYKNYIAECSTMMESINDKDLETFEQLFFSKDFLNSTDENKKTMKSKINQSLIKILNERNSIPKEVIVDHFKSSFNFIITDQDKLLLNERQFPISVLSGTNDTLFSFNDSLKLIDIIKPESFAVIQGSGHGIPNERLSDFNIEMNKTINTLKRNNQVSEFTIYNNLINNKSNPQVSIMSSSNSLYYKTGTHNNINNIIKPTIAVESPTNKYTIGLKFIKNFKRFK